MSGHYLVDLSNHDWSRGSMAISKLPGEGFLGATHKCAEGDHFYADPYWKTFYQRAKASKLSYYGAYFVLHGGNVTNQVKWFVSILDNTAPGWRSDPKFVVQLDAEKFSYMSRAPYVSECNAFYDAIKKYKKTETLGYLPKWLYGSNFSYKGPLWASSYVNGDNKYASQLYPGDSSSLWAKYGGKAPLILQFSSKAKAIGQYPMDVNYCKLSPDALLAELGNEEDMPTADEIATATVIKLLSVTGVTDKIPAPNNAPDISTNPNWTFPLAMHGILNRVYDGAPQWTQILAIVTGMQAQMNALVESVGQAGGIDVSKLQAEMQAAMDNAVKDFAARLEAAVSTEVAANEAKKA